MKPITIFSFAAIFLAGMAFLSPDSETGNWPCFRGATNMTAEGANLPDQWSTDTNIAWTYDIEGEGWSSPVIWGDRAFVLSVIAELVSERPTETRPQPPAGGQNAPVGQNPATPGQGQSAQAPPPPPQDQDTAFKQEVYRWEVICLDMKSGAELWKKVALKGHPRTNKHRMSNYASETPVTDGQRVYAWFGMHGLYCYDMDGNFLWQKDLGSFSTTNGWGTGSSPVLYNNTLYIQMDNEEQSFITALDAETGNEKWRIAREEKTNYSTPVIWQNKKRTELVVGGNTARGYDPATGKTLWQLKIGGDRSIPSAVFDNELLYISNTGQRVQGKFYALKPGAEGDITLPESDSSSAWIEWSSSKAGQGNPSPLLYKGLLYLISSRGGEFTCLDPASGKIMYKEKISGVGAVWASPWAYNDRIFFYDENGKTHVIQAGPQYRHLDTNRLEDKFWASVAIAGNALLFRGVDKLYCVRK